MQAQQAVSTLMTLTLLCGPDDYVADSYINHVEPELTLRQNTQNNPTPSDPASVLRHHHSSHQAVLRVGVEVPRNYIRHPDVYAAFTESRTAEQVSEKYSHTDQTGDDACMSRVDSTDFCLTSWARCFPTALISTTSITSYDPDPNPFHLKPTGCPSSYLYLSASPYPSLYRPSVLSLSPALFPYILSRPLRLMQYRGTLLKSLCYLLHCHCRLCPYHRSFLCLSLRPSS
jgi:hypothetical protein